MIQSKIPDKNIWIWTLKQTPQISERIPFLFKWGNQAGFDSPSRCSVSRPSLRSRSWILLGLDSRGMKAIFLPDKFILDYMSSPLILPNQKSTWGMAWTTTEAVRRSARSKISKRIFSRMFFFVFMETKKSDFCFWVTNSFRVSGAFILCTHPLQLKQEKNQRSKSGTTVVFPFTIKYISSSSTTGAISSKKRPFFSLSTVLVLLSLISSSDHQSALCYCGEWGPSASLITHSKGKSMEKKKSVCAIYADDAFSLLPISLRRREQIVSLQFDPKFKNETFP